MSPQAIYYHRKKAGLTGSRQNPDRHWRKGEPVTREPAGPFDWNTGKPTVFSKLARAVKQA